jgi:propanediol dehydratase small subunit
VALSGRAVSEITLDAVRAGELSLADLRIHPETLERQAVVAEEHGNPQLAANLRRAAELTAIEDEEVLAIYEALRPGRSTAAELTALAESLSARGLPLCAALVAEAAEVYARRGLVRDVSAPRPATSQPQPPPASAATQPQPPAASFAPHASPASSRPQAPLPDLP